MTDNIDLPSLRILVVEDSIDLAENIGDYLHGKGHKVDFAMDGLSGLHLLLTEKFDAVVLDIILPGLDGLTLCRKLKQEAGYEIPVLMLTARDTLSDKLKGFESGADDYLVKPFALEELAARIGALTRRGDKKPHSLLRIADLQVDPGKMEVRRAGQKIELNQACLDENEYHIAIEKLPGQGKTLYLLYDVGALEFTETRKLDIGFVLFGGVFVVIGLGWWIGRLTSRRIIAPVVHLSQQVGKSGPESLPTDLSRDFIDDEVGTLATALEQSMKRVEDFVVREHQFSRDASHELRTPVTVIKGAVELLRSQLPSHDASVLRPLSRIERQVSNMERIIEALLWLSREKTPSKSEQPFPIFPLVRDVIEENRNLIAGKSVDLNLVADRDPMLHVPAPLFQIALANLIQNAIHYTVNGHITVYVLEDRVLVSDSGSGIEELDLDHIVEPYVRGDDSNGFGLGLSIVNRLCNRFGWRLDIQSQAGKGTTAQLIFR